jgi:hypothetical protein
LARRGDYPVLYLIDDEGAGRRGPDPNVRQSKVRYLIKWLHALLDHTALEQAAGQRPGNNDGKAQAGEDPVRPRFRISTLLSTCPCISIGGIGSSILTLP